MSPRRLVVLGAVSFLAGLVTRAPARLVPFFLPADISMSGVSGTVWNGSARQLAVNHIAAGRLDWRVLPLDLLRGRLGTKLNAQLPDGEISGQVAMGMGGTMEIKNLRGSIPLAYVATDFPAGMLEGRVSLMIEQAELQDAWPTRIKGVVALGNLVHNYPKPTALGTFSATFDGAQKNAGEVLGVISTSSGPLQVDGDLTLGSNRSFVLESAVAAKPDTPDDIKSMLPLVGEQLADGRYRLHYTGTL